LVAELLAVVGGLYVTQVFYLAFGGAIVADDAKVDIAPGAKVVEYARFDRVFD